jgi:DNA-binding NtrC family response regulator
MQRAQVIVYGMHDEAVERLRAKLQDRGVWIRLVRHPGPCLDLVRQEGPAVVVLQIGADLDKEMSLLQRLGEWFPDTACIVVSAEANPPLAGLAWDLGAAYVLAPPQSADLLLEIVLGFLERSSRNR